MKIVTKRKCYMADRGVCTYFVFWPPYRQPKNGNYPGETTSSLYILLYIDFVYIPTV